MKKGKQLNSATNFFKYKLLNSEEILTFLKTLKLLHTSLLSRAFYMSFKNFPFKKALVPYLFQNICTNQHKNTILNQNCAEINISKEITE